MELAVQMLYATRARHTRQGGETRAASPYHYSHFGLMRNASRIICAGFAKTKAEETRIANLELLLAGHHHEEEAR